FCVQMSNCSVPILRMQSASLALEELLVTAQKQHCLTVGIYESAKLLNADPDSVVLCVLAADDEEDVALQIHFTLLQSFCCDSGINILRVSGVQRLWQLLGGVDANRNQEESGDLHCMLVTVDKHAAASTAIAMAEYNHFSEPSRAADLFCSLACSRQAGRNSLLPLV
uniref:Growth arrest and DNA-damage-inducible, beta b n=1 Tax=Xiphophorus couchianus TaxID=32473 RepID=A0A3B5M3W1_9TELE